MIEMDRTYLIIIIDTLLLGGAFAGASIGYILGRYTK